MALGKREKPSCTYLTILKRPKLRCATKNFIGKDIIHVAIFKKKDKRTIYNLIYRDGKSGSSFIKRFAVTSTTRDREYDVTQGKKDSKIHYFSANPNGE